MMENIVIGITTGLISSVLATLLFQANQNRQYRVVKKMVFQKDLGSIMYQASRFMSLSDKKLFNDACDPDFLKSTIEKKVRPTFSFCEETIKNFTTFLTKKEFNNLVNVKESAYQMLNLIDQKSYFDEMIKHKEEMQKYYFSLWDDTNKCDTSENHCFNEAESYILNNYKVILLYLNSFYDLMKSLSYLTDKKSVRNFKSDLVIATELYNEKHDLYINRRSKNKITTPHRKDNL